MRSRVVRSSALALVVAVSLLCASTAFAKTQVYKFFNICIVKNSWSIPGVSNCTYPGSPPSTPPGPSPHFGVGIGTFSFPAVGSEIHSAQIDGCTGGSIFAHTIQSGGCAPTGPWSSAIGTGGGTAGIAAANTDTSFAKDSLAVTVTQNSTSVTLGNIRGRMMAKANGKSESGTGTIILAVYPDSATAKADVNNAGVGAVFFGRAYFNSTGKINLAPASGVPGFTGTDFGGPGVDASGNSFVALTGSTKIVNVPNGNNAAVVLISDPGNGSIVPGSSPVALVIVSVLLAMAGAAFLTVSVRPRAA